LYTKPDFLISVSSSRSNVFSDENIAGAITGAMAGVLLV